jgi:hypothetical protein
MRTLAALLGAAALTVPAPATAAAQCATPAGVYRDGIGWAQRLADPRRIWPLTDGSGQILAVLGTGVDQTNAQFGPGQVLPGSDGTDCDGRGTFAAGVVAARPDSSTTFAGMAPGVKVLALRYTESTGNATSGDGPDPDALAATIGRATDADAGVILVVVPALRTSPALDAAVRNALSRNVVVVSPAVADKPEARSYPTSLPGVIGVGAHDRAGLPVQVESGPHLVIAAPGNDLVSTSAGTGGKLGHRWGVSNPTFAAGYVAGAAVLVRAYRPALDPAQVLERLTRTANRSPAGGRDPRLGWGVLDVQAAVTAETAPGASAGTGPPTAVVPAAAPAKPPAHNRLPGVLAVLGVGLAGLAVVAVAVTRRGRARGWRTGN